MQNAGCRMQNPHKSPDSSLSPPYKQVYLKTKTLTVLSPEICLTTPASLSADISGGHEPCGWCRTVMFPGKTRSRLLATQTRLIQGPHPPFFA